MQAASVETGTCIIFLSKKKKKRQKKLITHHRARPRNIETKTKTKQKRTDTINESHGTKRILGIYREKLTGALPMPMPDERPPPAAGDGYAPPPRAPPEAAEIGAGTAPLPAGAGPRAFTLVSDSVLRANLKSLTV